MGWRMAIMAGSALRIDAAVSHTGNGAAQGAMVAPWKRPARFFYCDLPRRLTVDTFRLRVACLVCGGLLIVGCAKPGAQSGPPTKVTKIAPGPDAQKQAQTALINAKPGEVIEFGEGKFELTSTLSCDVSDITIRGQGSGQDHARLRPARPRHWRRRPVDHAARRMCTITDLAVDGRQGRRHQSQRLRRADFPQGYASAGPAAPRTNGAYGLYPVLCKNVLIEDCYVSDASDAGIYVGQSEKIIVRRNKAEKNVAGIEIENSIDADVYENVATGNTGGILVFSLPDLQAKVGQQLPRLQQRDRREQPRELCSPRATPWPTCRRAPA